MSAAEIVSKIVVIKKIFLKYEKTDNRIYNSIALVQIRQFTNIEACAEMLFNCETFKMALIVAAGQIKTYFNRR